jgi:hypothetical protein
LRIVVDFATSDISVAVERLQIGTATRVSASSEVPLPQIIMGIHTKHRKVLRLWAVGAKLEETVPPSWAELRARLSRWRKPLNADENHTIVRVNDVVVWIGCTAGSYSRGTLRATREFWCAPGFRFAERLLRDRLPEQNPKGAPGK